MLDTVAKLGLAISLASNVNSTQAFQYAKTIQKRSDDIGIDPLTAVAIIAHESNFDPAAISSNHEDYGLFQVRARYYGGDKLSLLNPSINLMVGFYLIRLNKEMCEKVLDREPNTQEWLACFQGSCTSKERMCRPTVLTQQIDDFAECLRDDVEGGFTMDCRSNFRPVCMIGGELVECGKRAS